MRLTWSDSVRTVPGSAWGSLDDGRNVYVSLPWLRATSRGWSAPQPFLVACRGDDVVAALPTYLMERGRGGLYDPDLLFGDILCAGAGDPCPYPFLLAGSRSGYSTEIALARDLDRRERDELVHALVAAAEARAAELGAAGVGFLYLNSAGLGQLGPCLRERGYAIALLSAEARLAIPWDDFDGYVGSLPSGRRSVVRRDLNAFTRSGHVVRRTTLAGHERVLAPLLVNVQRRYGHPADRDALERSLTAIGQELGSRAVLFLLEGGAGVVGFCLCLRWGRRLFARLVGFDYSSPVRDSYFTLLFYEPIRYAISCGLEELHLGTEGLEAKARRGARLVALWGAVLMAGVAAGRLEDWGVQRLRRLREDAKHPIEVQD